MQQQQIDMSQALSGKLKPRGILPLFHGGDFDAEYNSKYKPVDFVPPPGSKQAFLEAVVTGLLCILDYSCLSVSLSVWLSVHLYVHLAGL